MSFHRKISLFCISFLLLPLSRLQSFADSGRAASETKASGGGSTSKVVVKVKGDKVESSILRGIEFLLNRQNPNGSWGSPRNTKALNIFAPVPGAHHAFRNAVTSLCICALLEAGTGEKEVAEAVRKAEDFLYEHLPELRRATPSAMYNVWGHAYGTHALTRLFKLHREESKTRNKIRRLLNQQVDMLARYQCVGGGWAYYDFNAHTKQPSGAANSFTTATVLVALKKAENAGIQIDPAMVRRAKELILRQRKPDFSYLYSQNHMFYPMAPINRPGGSLGRSQACNIAMRYWGDKAVSNRILIRWLTRLFRRNGWLSIGRKRPVPHESWFQVAGYFFYYGHYYASLCIEELKPERKRVFQKQLAQLLAELQEKDGSWFDYPFYDYHKQYGTAFALLSLAKCRS